MNQDTTTFSRAPSGLLKGKIQKGKPPKVSNQGPPGRAVSNGAKTRRLPSDHSVRAFGCLKAYGEFGPPCVNRAAAKKHFGKCQWMLCACLIRACPNPPTPLPGCPTQFSARLSGVSQSGPRADCALNNTLGGGGCDLTPPPQSPH